VFRPAGVITGSYGSGIWTAGIAADFRFENNVVDDCRYAWTYQGAAPAPQFLFNPDGSMSDDGGVMSCGTLARLRPRVRAAW
jgi:hypothetical protein